MAEQPRRGRIYREALLAVNGLGNRHRALGKLVAAASFGEGLVPVRSPDGAVRKGVEPGEVDALIEAGWTRA